MTDTASIIFERKDMVVPDDGVPLTPKDKYFNPGVEISWLGFPAIPRANLCFFSGRISAWIQRENAYLVDGVAINGVSGGPAFIGGDMLIGVVSAYIPNRSTGEPLPGLEVVGGVNQYHELAQEFQTMDQAKAQETPPAPAWGSTYNCGFDVPPHCGFEMSRQWGGMKLQICRKMFNWDRVGLMVLLFIPAVWQVQTVKPTLFFDFLWDGCDKIRWTRHKQSPQGPAERSDRR